LDVGGASIKLVQVEAAANGRPSLAKHLIQELPARSAEESGQHRQLAEWLQPALKEFPALPIAVAIAGPEVIVRRLDVPPMSAKELREAVRWQIKDELPFPIQEAVVDCAVIGEVWDKDVKKQDVLVAAAPRATVQALVATIERAGGQVASVTPGALAAWAGIAALDQAAAGAIAVVEIGHQASTVAIVKDRQVRVTRELQVGGRGLTDALVGTVASEHGERAIDPATAEALKRRYGVLADDASGVSEEGVPLFHVASLMRPVLEQALTDLSRFLDFYRLQVDPAGVSRVLLCGGGAAVKGLAAFLSDGLGIPVSVWNPLARMATARPLEEEQVADDGPRLAVAAGLAVAPERLLNLLPAGASGGAAAAIPWPMLAARASIALAVAGLCLVLVGVGFHWQAVRARAQWERLHPHYDTLMHASAQQRAMEQAVRGLETFLASQPVWEGVFKDVGHLMPKGIELEGLEIRAGAPPTLRLRGRVLAASDGGAAQLVEALERSPLFGDAELASSELHSEPGKTRFEIEASLE
jgi:type IV pilus assembly protein PilM